MSRTSESANDVELGEQEKLGELNEQGKQATPEGLAG